MSTSNAMPDIAYAATPIGSWKLKMGRAAAPPAPTPAMEALHLPPVAPRMKPISAIQKNPWCPGRWRWPRVAACSATAAPPVKRSSRTRAQSRCATGSIALDELLGSGLPGVRFTLTRPFHEEDRATADQHGTRPGHEIDQRLVMFDWCAVHRLHPFDASCRREVGDAKALVRGLPQPREPEEPPIAAARAQADRRERADHAAAVSGEALEHRAAGELLGVAALQHGALGALTECLDPGVGRIEWDDAQPGVRAGGALGDQELAARAGERRLGVGPRAHGETGGAVVGRVTDAGVDEQLMTGDASRHSDARRLEPAPERPGVESGATAQEIVSIVDTDQEPTMLRGGIRHRHRPGSRSEATVRHSEGNAALERSAAASRPPAGACFST